MVLTSRSAGMLLHPTSLPGASLGAPARRFLDWLDEAGFSVWQTLPLMPPDDCGSPYASRSGNAISADLLDAGEFVQAGLISADDARDGRFLERAWDVFKADASATQRAAFDGFVDEQAYWLDDFVLFEAFRNHHAEASWWQWPRPLRDREETALRALAGELRDEIELLRFEQFCLSMQWRALREDANGRGIRLFGDVPLYVAWDSADVWAHRGAFELNPDGSPIAVAGVPPDYFSEVGQLWGNPLYDWPTHERSDFAWWRARFRRQGDLFDILRIDHFRGLEAYWAVPFGEETAVKGTWRKAPGHALLKSVTEAVPELSLVAEDLGEITDEVFEMRDRFGLPGMKILQFAFDGEADNVFLPHNIQANSVAYTGTHDNDTTIGWAESISERERDYVVEYLELPGSSSVDILHGLVDTVLACNAALGVLPMQDVLELGTEHRSNTPGTDSGNWTFAFDWAQLDSVDATRWRERLRRVGRDNRPAPRSAR